MRHWWMYENEECFWGPASRINVQKHNFLTLFTNLDESHYVLGKKYFWVYPLMLLCLNSGPIA